MLYRRGKTATKTLKLHLGTSAEHTVYEAELVGTILGLELLRKALKPSVRKASIALDNQAAVRACRSRHHGPGQYLLGLVRNQVDRIKAKFPQVQLVIRWVPGHMDVEGNEKADRTAKRAARGHSSRRLLLPRCLRQKLPLSSSKLRQLRKEYLTTQAKTLWKSSPRFAKLDRIDSSLPSDKFSQLIAGIPRRHAAILFQLRTGHTPLNQYLHRINRAATPLCPACEMYPETVHHYLLSCPAYERARMALFYEVGRPAKSITSLLTSKKLIRPLFRFIHSTGRFAARLGDMALPKETPEGNRQKNQHKRNGQQRAHPRRTQ